MNEKIEKKSFTLKILLAGEKELVNFHARKVSTLIKRL